MLAPDGTLYVVCRDKFLYAFHDPIVGDLDEDGDVDATDLAILLGNWGPCFPEPTCLGDLNEDSGVNAEDLAILLGNWTG